MTLITHRRYVVLGLYFFIELEYPAAAPPFATCLYVDRFTRPVISLTHTWMVVYHVVVVNHVLDGRLFSAWLTHY